jgi:hypothetical protein
MDNPTDMMTLTSSDGAIFELPVAATTLSGYVLQACGPGNGIESEDEILSPPGVDIHRVTSVPLGKIVDFLLYYQEVPMNGISPPFLKGSTFNEVWCAHEYEYENEYD